MIQEKEGQLQPKLAGDLLFKSPSLGKEITWPCPVPGTPHTRFSTFSFRPKAFFPSLPIALSVLLDLLAFCTTQNSRRHMVARNVASVGFFLFCRRILSSPIKPRYGTSFLLVFQQTTYHLVQFTGHDNVFFYHIKRYTHA